MADEQERRGKPAATEVATYIAAQLPEFIDRAEANGLETLAYLLKLARAEAARLGRGVKDES